MTASRSLLLAGVLTLTAACQKSDTPAPLPDTTQSAQIVAPKVTAITLTKEIDENVTPLAPTDVFATTDTIFAVIDLVGAPVGMPVTTRWYYVTDNEMINESSVNTTEGLTDRMPFFIVKTDGWPQGDYKVEVLLGDALQLARNFKVQ